MRDQKKIAAYYKKEYARLIAQRTDSGAVIPDIDDHFADIFTASYPRCSGVAMGIDRLLMLQSGLTSLEGVILFPLSAMMQNG